MQKGILFVLIFIVLLTIVHYLLSWYRNRKKKK